MWVRSDITSGRNQLWEWRPEAGDAEDGKTTSDASGRGAHASDAGLTFADGATTTSGKSMNRDPLSWSLLVERKVLPTCSRKLFRVIAFLTFVLTSFSSCFL